MWHQLFVAGNPPMQSMKGKKGREQTHHSPNLSHWKLPSRGIPCSWGRRLSSPEPPARRLHKSQTGQLVRTLHIPPNLLCNVYWIYLKRNLQRMALVLLRTNVAGLSLTFCSGRLHPNPFICWPSSTYGEFFWDVQLCPIRVAGGGGLASKVQESCAATTSPWMSTTRIRLCVPPYLHGICLFITAFY